MKLFFQYDDGKSRTEGGFAPPNADAARDPITDVYGYFGEIAGTPDIMRLRMRFRRSMTQGEVADVLAKAAEELRAGQGDSVRNGPRTKSGERQATTAGMSEITDECRLEILANNEVTPA